VTPAYSGSGGDQTGKALPLLGADENGADETYIGLIQT